MFASTSSNRGRVYGSSRLHPYAQKLPVNPPTTIWHPKPTRIPAYRVLRYRSRSNSRSRTPSPRRRGRRTSGISALSIDGNYDDDDMSGVLMQNAADTNHKPSVAEHVSLLAKPHAYDLTLPLPTNWTPYDNISYEQRGRLDRGPVKFLNVTEVATPRTPAQVRALLHPRVCIDSDANIVDRFVTDCEKSSGRVYDRLFRRELVRITPYADDSLFRPASSQVFDVYTGEIRKRCLFDDLRDSNARTEGVLEVIDDEKDLSYYPVRDN